MSSINVNTIKSRLGGPPTLPSGVVVSAAATFSNDVSIGGTLTYEDVTNIDSVGLITARNGIKIGAAGIGGTIAANGNTTLAGVVTATGFVGDVTGDLTGAVNTAAQTNITSVGTLTGLVVNGETKFGAAGVGGTIRANGDTTLVGVLTATKMVVNENSAFNDADEYLLVKNTGAACNISVVGGTGNHSSVNLGDTDDFNIQKIRSGHTDNSLAFFTNNAERLRFDSNGRTLIGTTSSLVNSPLLQVYQASSGSGAQILIRGDGNSYCEASVLGQVNSSSRGSGWYAHDRNANNEWFWGRPYSGNDQFIIARKTSPSNPGQDTAQTANSIMTVQSGGNVSIDDGNLLLASGHGIDFSATANSGGSMSSELLDDYEEGTFSPVFNGSNGGGTSRTGAGFYTKVGDIVTCFLQLNNADGSNFGGGYMKVTGLPYAATQQSWTTNIWLYRVGFDTARIPMFYIGVGDSFAYGYYSRNDDSWQPWYVSEWDATQLYARFHITYLA